MGSRPQKESDLPAIIGSEFKSVGPYGQMTYLEGKKRDLERAYRSVIFGIDITIERQAASQILNALLGWSFQRNEEQVSKCEPYTWGIWGVTFGAALDQWEVRKNGKWYRRKTK